MTRTEGPRSPCCKEQSDLVSKQSTSKFPAPIRSQGLGLPGVPGAQRQTWVPVPAQRPLLTAETAVLP